MRMISLRASAIVVGVVFGLAGVASLPALAAHGTINGNGWGKCAYDPNHTCGRPIAAQPVDAPTPPTGTIPMARRHVRQ